MRDASSPTQRFLARLPGWTLLIGGMFILAATVVMPAWRECRYLDWQLEVMRRQTDALARQVDAYEAFQRAVEDHDPIVLKRLAYHQLRAKPRGARLLMTTKTTKRRPKIRVAAGTSAAPLVRPTSPLEQTEHGSFIEAWLHQPLPRVGREIPSFRWVDSRLTRLTLGPPRLMVALFGMVCLLAGLVFHRPEDDELVTPAGSLS